MLLHLMELFARWNWIRNHQPECMPNSMRHNELNIDFAGKKGIRIQLISLKSQCKCDYVYNSHPLVLVWRLQSWPTHGICPIDFIQSLCRINTNSPMIGEYQLTEKWWANISSWCTIDIVYLYINVRYVYQMCRFCMRHKSKIHESCFNISHKWWKQNRKSYLKFGKCSIELIWTRNNF